MKTTRELMEKYLQKKQFVEGLSDNSIKNYKSDINTFVKWCEKNNFENIEKLENMTQIDFDDYFITLSRTPRTFNRKTIMLKNFIDYANDRNFNIFKPNVKQKKIPKREPFVITEEKIERLISIVDHRPFKTDEGSYIMHPKKKYLSKENIRDRAIFLTLLMTGLRADECLNLKMSDITEYEDDYKLNVIGKGNKERIVPMPRVAKETIDRWMRVKGHESEFIFTRTHNGNVKQLSHEMLKRRIRIYYDMANVEIKDSRPIHTIRRTYASMLNAKGVPLTEIMKYMGHSDIKITMGYISTIVERINEVAEIWNKKMDKGE
jgi:site-specific recombinase XerD